MKGAKRKREEGDKERDFGAPLADMISLARLYAKLAPLQKGARLRSGRRTVRSVRPLSRAHAGLVAQQLTEKPKRANYLLVYPSSFFSFA